MNMKDERQFVGYSKYRSRLVDGHVHTELCPHGSGDRTAMMIEKAIELRIEKGMPYRACAIAKGFCY